MRELHPELQYFCSTAERFKEDLELFSHRIHVEEQDDEPTDLGL